MEKEDGSKVAAEVPSTMSSDDDIDDSTEQPIEFVTSNDDLTFIDDDQDQEEDIQEDDIDEESQEFVRQVNSDVAPKTDEQVDAYIETQLYTTFSENMFLAETKGMTHWFLMYDDTHLHAYNIVRDAFQTLMTVSGVSAMAVDPIRGFIFLAIGDQVKRYPFEVKLGEDKMHPSIRVTSTANQVFLSEEVGDNVLSLTCDADQSVLYIGTTSKITVIQYATETIAKSPKADRLGLTTDLYPS